jgi:hypothetical protein
VILTGLKSLFKSMRRQDLERVRFQYIHGRVAFDVFFFIDEDPFCLLFGAVMFNVAFELAVRPGFEVDPHLPPEAYGALCKALGLRYDPQNPFSVKAFLTQFNAQIPSEIGPNTVRPEQILQYRRDVEEVEKIYFFQWRDNSVRGENVTPENLLKTRRILGISAYEVCKRRNISSCWTDDPAKRRDPPRLA